MDLETFNIFSPVHIVTLLACLVVSIAIAYFGCRWKSLSTHSRFLRGSVVAGCLLFWILSTGFWFQPQYFRWDTALPLQFCNLANLIGALAVARRIRAMQSLLYFWSFALCIWAFLTPSLDVGPAHVWFWIFWLYHLFILIAVLFTLAVDKFRPTWKDFLTALGLTFGYMVLLAILNAITGWNYGFVGAGTPIQPSPVDVLGPYPLRLVWMALIGTAVFAILMLPWLRRHSFSLPET